MDALGGYNDLRNSKLASDFSRAVADKECMLGAVAQGGGSFSLHNFGWQVQNEIGGIILIAQAGSGMFLKGSLKSIQERCFASQLPDCADSGLMTKNMCRVSVLAVCAVC